MLNSLHRTFGFLCLICLRYPNAAGKIVSNGPYSSVSEIYNIKGLTGEWGKELIMYRYR